MASTSDADTVLESTPTPAAVSSGSVSNDTDSGLLASNDANGSDTKGTGFPVAAMIGVSVAGGLGAMVVAMWALFMWQRRRRWNQEMLKGISDDRMMQLDSIYEAARPKTFDTAGRETVYGLDRQDTSRNRPDPGHMYFRAGPQRSPQIIGGFAGATMGGGPDGRTPAGMRDLPKDTGLGPYYR